MSPRVPILLLAAALAACGGATEEPSGGTASGSSPAGPTTSASGVVDPSLDDVVDAALGDLAHRLGVPEGEITVRSAERVSWGDTSLGCPEEGRRYAQVITPGSRVVLAHEGTTYEYHADDEGRVVSCEDPGDPVEGFDRPPESPITDPAR